MAAHRSDLSWHALLVTSPVKRRVPRWCQPSFIPCPTGSSPPVGCGHRAFPGVLLDIHPRLSPCEVILLLRDDLPIPCINNIADAIVGAAATGEIRIPFRIILIVVLMRQFFPCLNIAQSDDPNSPGCGLQSTVRIAGMID